MANVSKTFKRVNPRKAVGLDGIPSRVLRACTDQLAGVFTDIFNQSLSQSAPPIHIDGTVVEKVESCKFLGIHIADKLKWYTHIDSVVKKAQQRLFNLRRLKKFGLSSKTTHKLLQMHNREHPVGLYFTPATASCLCRMPSLIHIYIFYIIPLHLCV
jgi:hypothetical protein